MAEEGPHIGRRSCAQQGIAVLAVEKAFEQQKIRAPAPDPATTVLIDEIRTFDVNPRRVGFEDNQCKRFPWAGARPCRVHRHVWRLKLRAQKVSVVRPQADAAALLNQRPLLPWADGKTIGVHVVSRLRRLIRSPDSESSVSPDR